MTYLTWPQSRSVPYTGVCGLSFPFGLAYSPLLSILSPAIFLVSSLIKYSYGLHWPNTPLKAWPGACKLPLSGWLLYLYWFKLFPLPIHYAGIPPCWGQLCYSFLWLKPKNYLSNSLGTNPLRVNILSWTYPHNYLLKQELSPQAPTSSFARFFKEMETGVEWESDVMSISTESERNTLGIALV